MFFDGTGQNGLNSSKGPGSVSKGASYKNGPSNIYDLYQSYKDDKIYIEGIGTTTDGFDSYLEASPYRAGASGKEKIAKALNKLKLIAFEAEKKGFSIDLDIFGFSRGAALARHFANTINIKNTDVNFLGLYDTVVSIKNNKLQTKVDENLKNVVHICALHEARENFALLRINDDENNLNYFDILRNRCEIFVPGCHSDIGGGYIDQHSENNPVNSDTDIIKMSNDSEWGWLFAYYNSSSKSIVRENVFNFVREYYFNMMADFYFKFTGYDAFERKSLKGPKSFEDYLRKVSNNETVGNIECLADISKSLHNSSKYALLRGVNESTPSDSDTDNASSLIIEMEDEYCDESDGATMIGYSAHLSKPRTINGKWVRLIRKNGTYNHNHD